MKSKPQREDVFKALKKKIKTGGLEHIYIVPEREPT